MKFKSVIFFLSFVLIVSCRRKGDASGKVINVLNGKTIADIGVNLDEYKIAAISAKRVTRSLANTTTNSSGEYSFKYGPKVGSGYNRLISIDNRHFSPMDTSAVLDKKYEIGNYPGCEKVKWDYSGHSRTGQDFYMAPLARIKVIPHNVTHIYDGASLRIDLFDDNDSKLAGYYDNGNNLSNCNYYTQFPSNGRINIVWQLWGNNFYDTIHVEPFAKTIYHFNY